MFCHIGSSLDLSNCFRPLQNATLSRLPIQPTNVAEPSKQGAAARRRASKPAAKTRTERTSEASQTRKNAQHNHGRRPTGHTKETRAQSGAARRAWEYKINVQFCSVFVPIRKWPNSGSVRFVACSLLFPSVRHSHPRPCQSFRGLEHWCRYAMPYVFHFWLRSVTSRCRSRWLMPPCRSYTEVSCSHWFTFL